MPERCFVVGAQRSGTSYLHRVLDEHPHIAMAKPLWPEPKFFFDDEQYERGVDWYDRTYFPEADPADVWGEKSVVYLESAKAVERIHTTFPSARIVAMVRNPVDRAVSNYRFSVQNGLEELPIEQALTADEAGRAGRDGDFFVVANRRIGASPFAYRTRGRYVSDLRRYARLFGTDHVLVLVFEATVGSAGAVSRLYEFVGADPGFRPPSLHAIVNRAAADLPEIPEPLRHRLEEEFIPWNAALAEEFSLDLSAWR